MAVASRKYAYHMTWDWAIDSIRQQGLKPGQVSTNPGSEKKVHWQKLWFSDNAQAYRERGKLAKHQVLLRFAWPAEFKYEGKVDDHEYSTTLTIRPQDLEIKTKDGWQHLRPRKFFMFKK